MSFGILFLLVQHIMTTSVLGQLDGMLKIVEWQSFDHPCDTFLSGMKVGVDFQAKLVWKYTSWKSDIDPSPGEYYYMPEVHGHGLLETFIMRGLTRISQYYEPWNGVTFMASNSMLKLGFVSNEHEIYYTVQLISNSTLGRVLLNSTGALQFLLWSEKTNGWILFEHFPANPCDSYAVCGANSICNPNYKPVCQCLMGFLPRSLENSKFGKYLMAV